MITVRGRPTISSAVQPNSRSAPPFQVSTRPELSADTIASTAASVTAWNRSWEAARASEARRRSTREGAELLGHPGDALQAARLAGPLVGDEQLQHRHHPVGAGHGHGHRLPDPGPLGGHGPVEPARVADVVQQQRLAPGPGSPGRPSPSP
jgi:hypothetical protein